MKCEYTASASEPCFSLLLLFAIVFFSGTLQKLICDKASGKIPSQVRRAFPATTMAAKNEEEYHVCEQGEKLRCGKNKYRVTSGHPLGRGTFGVVYLVTADLRDRRTCPLLKTKAAIKIIRKRYEADGRNEADILHRIKKEMEPIPKDDRRCLEILDWFMEPRIKYYCIVTELLHKSLAKFLDGPERRTLNFQDLRIVVHQVLTALLFLQERIKLIHTDLKPDNIVLVRPNSFHVKVIDFGTALLKERIIVDGRIRFGLQTLNYRSPEILLKYYPYNEAMDMWSLGVIMLELFTNKKLKHPLLYNCYCEYDLMRHIVEVQGMPPETLLDEGRDTTKYFNKTMNLQGWRLMTPEEYTKSKDFQTQKEKNPPLHEAFVFRADLTGILDGFGSVALFQKPTVSAGSTPLRFHTQERSNFGNLLNRMLEVNPVERITPSEALQHPFFDRYLR